MHSGEMSTIQIRVLVASSGLCVPLCLFPHEFTVSNIRKHLAGVVPLEDQILLLGPPYKVPKDATIQSEEVLATLRLGDEEDEPSYCELTQGSNTDSRHRRRKPISPASDRAGARRLFLFSKQALADSAPEPTPCLLQPMDIVLPAQPDASPVALSLRTTIASAAAASSPLFQALQVYERRFMLHLCQGRALADAADMRILAARNCISEQLVITRAIRAAVYNLSDHRNAAIRTRTEFTAEFQATSAAHANLLDNFDTLLNSLATIPLHPALVALARASGQGGGVQTLLDTVPVERERAWANQCRTAHARLANLFQELDQSFTHLTHTKDTLHEEINSDTMAEHRIHQLSLRVEGLMADLRDLQEERLQRLVAEHKEVVAIILGTVEGDQTSPQTLAHAAFARLETLSQASADLIPSMTADDLTLKDIMVTTAESKTMAMKHVRNRLRQVSQSQSAIQKVLANVAILKEAMAQQVENMSHLDHVAQLKHAYRDFITEVRRRKAYCGAVTATASSLMDRLAILRADEVKAREAFLRGSGRHLMPCFFDTFVPTLATPPPLFTPQLPSMMEAETLPFFGLMDDDNERHDISTYDLRSDSQESSDKIEKKTFGFPSDSGLSHTAMDTRTTNTLDTTDKKKSLIVSADETSTNEIIMGSGSRDDSEDHHSDADQKILAYENAMLRQIIERMSGKSPQPYLQDRFDESTKQKNAPHPMGSKSNNYLENNESQILRKELEVTKSLLIQANDALEEKRRKDLVAEESKNRYEQDKINDKISHSSFNIGDVALFMPTGREKTYLAFHTNCPHRYLSSDCIRGNPNFVLGRIVMQEQHIAGDTVASNPHGLVVGTKFWILTVEILGK